jgi:hypothetical protein
VAVDVRTRTALTVAVVTRAGRTAGRLVTGAAGRTAGAAASLRKGAVP